MTTVKDLVSQIQLDEDFQNNGKMVLPPNAAAVVILPADPSIGSFATAAVQRWMPDLPEGARNFYYAVVVGTLDAIANDVDAIVKAAVESKTDIRPLDKLDVGIEDESDDPEMSIKNEVEFGKPTITMTPPKLVTKDDKLEDLEPAGKA